LIPKSRGAIGAAVWDDATRTPHLSHGNASPPAIAEAEAKLSALAVAKLARMRRR
jgi:hypothetical protein